jgi:hypothetical protein
MVNDIQILLRILEIGERQLKEGKVRLAQKVLADLRKKAAS